MSLQKKHTRFTQLIWLLPFISLAVGCSDNESNQEELQFCYSGVTNEMLSEFGVMNGALLATHFDSLSQFKRVVGLTYVSSDSSVIIMHCNGSNQVKNHLRPGVTQKDFANARDSNWVYSVKLLFKSPFAARNRNELKSVFELARRKPMTYGEGDVAFFDLAQACVDHIYDDQLLKFTDRDSTEKGYLNTFNHMTAQALVTSIYSEEIAGFMADVHERYNMPELLTGNFTPEQLTNPDNNPIDNYVDIVNNEWGQELGKALKKKYGISQNTEWSYELLVNYLNDMQAYYSWALQVGFEPFKTTDQVVVRFTNKLNQVLNEGFSTD